jgi:sugar phosphate isomerase/epimerase
MPNTAMFRQSRRRFLQLSAASVAALGLVSLSGNAAQKTVRKQPAVGLQLYTIRDLMAQNVATTLQLVAGIGYTEVEFAGYFAQNPAQLRKQLDALGLRAPSCHLPLETLQQDLAKAMDEANTLGHRYLVLPYLTTEQRGTDLGSYQRLAAELNQIGEKCRAQGLQLAYHNHDFEFQDFAGKTPYQVLLTETDAQLVKMELDLFWTIKAGVDPLALFAKHPGRFPLWHVKDLSKSGEMADVGTGTIDFSRYFAKAAEAGLQHHYIEHDQSPNKILTIQRGFATVKGILAARQG